MSFMPWAIRTCPCPIPVIVLIPILLVTHCSGTETRKNNLSYNIEEIGDRRVYLSFPKGSPPLEGWPIVILLHGRGQSGGAWFGKGPLSIGEQKFFPPILVDSGFAVLAPDGAEPFRKGLKEWDFFHRKRENSKDIPFFESLFSWMEKNPKLKFDMNKLYVAGISSGGFMTSRLAQAFPLKFRAACVIAAGNPDSFRFVSDLPLAEEADPSPAITSKHPPTLILHGTKDNIVPLEKGERYYQELKKAGVETEIHEIPGGRHLWPEQYNQRIVQWFITHAKTASEGEKKEKDMPVDELTYSQEDSGKKIALRPGGFFQVQLKGVPTAGYKWEIMDLDQTKIKIADQGVKSLTPPRNVGGRSLFTWRFQAEAPGDCRLMIKYFRPWEGADKALETFTLDLEILREK